MTDLEELEQFAKTFKQRRIKLGKFSDILKTTAASGKNNESVANKIIFSKILTCPMKRSL